ncbi:hypothetical protein AMECASPLE_038672 [Ameca splendens]|uniref:Uncharacterized protein n=1 Tax=Ameca splendens TaxID=208324 RepID=A0ABV0Z6H4_9TELE
MELPPEDVEEFCNLADTILHLCAASAVCSSRIAAWQTLLQRQMWLRLSSSIPEDFKRELLEGPISPDGLFGPHFQSVLGQMQTSQEELERVRRHGSLNHSGLQSSHTTGRWRDRRDERQQQRRSTAAAAAPRVPPPTAPSTQPQQQRRGRQLACAWSNPPQEPRWRFKK